MLIDSEAIVNISDANQNFSKITKLVDSKKKVVIMKNNKPKYIITEFPNENNRIDASSEVFNKSVEKVISKNIEVLERLAK